LKQNKKAKKKQLEKANVKLGYSTKAKKNNWKESNKKQMQYKTLGNKKQAMGGKQLLRILPNSQT